MSEQFQVWPELGYAGKAVPGEVLLPPHGMPAHVNVSLHKLLAAHGQEAEAAKAPTIRGRISMTGAARFSIPESIGCSGRRDALQFGLALVKLWELAATLMPQLDDEDPFDFAIEIRPVPGKVAWSDVGDPASFRPAWDAPGVIRPAMERLEPDLGPTIPLPHPIGAHRPGSRVLLSDENPPTMRVIDDTNTEPLTPEQHEKILEMGRKPRTGEGL